MKNLYGGLSSIPTGLRMKGRYVRRGRRKTSAGMHLGGMSLKKVIRGNQHQTRKLSKGVF